VLHAGRPGVEDLRVGECGQGRQRGGHHGRVEVHGLVENDLRPAEATPGAALAGHELQPLTADQFDLLGAAAFPHALNPAGKVVIIGDKPLHSQEMLTGCLEKVRGMRDQPISEQIQPAELHRLKKAALAVLPGHDHADLEAQPGAHGIG
jgi:hypothetical protein